jgi:D-alanine-D-alanine ligase
MPRTGAGRTVAILHGAVPPNAPPDDQDTLVQVDVVAAAIMRLGYRPEPVPVTLDLAAMLRRLEAMKPIIVFNLVESIGGVGRHLHLPAAAMDAAGIPYTGCGAVALIETGNKLIAKRRLKEAGIATPAWRASGDPAHSLEGGMIVKPVWEDASIGIDAGAVATGWAAARRRMAEMRARLGGEWFAEAFVDGREFNVALLETPERAPDDPLVLPAAELRYVDFPPGMPRIADYASKWDKDSFAYRNTPLSLDLPPGDAAMVARMGGIARACWRLFGLAGYARVDFRCDSAGEPVVLEVNPNPCLSPDSGFGRMLERSGMDFDRGIEAIIEARLRRHAVVRRTA